MTHYRSIEPVQQPFDLGVDTNSRSKVAFNILAISEMTLSFLEEIGQRLEDSAVGVLGVDMFLSSSWVIPQGGGPYLTVIETGGMSPERTQNEINPPAYIRPAAQIAVYAASYPLARAMALNAYLALNVRNVDIGTAPPFPSVAVPAGRGTVRYHLWNETADATPVELFRDGSSLRVTLETGVSLGFGCRIVGKSGTAQVAHYLVEGLISNNAGTVAFNGDTDLTILYESAPGLAAVAIADNVNKALVIQVTGLAATAINWNADLQGVRSGT